MLSRIRVRWQPIQGGVVIVDRGEDIALSEFAPDHEIVKDKKVIRSVGVAWPSPPASAFAGRVIRFLEPNMPPTILTFTQLAARLPSPTLIAMPRV